MPQSQPAPDVADSVPASGREAYLRTVVGQLTSALSDILSPAEAEGFISISAQKACASLDPVPAFSRAEVATVLIALQAGIGADFYLSEELPDSIMLGNRACPFGPQVRGRTSLCMTTSNILGSTVAKHLGYARIELRRTIAEGQAECLIAIHFSASATAAEGREYYGTLSSGLKND